MDTTKMTWKHIIVSGKDYLILEPKTIEELLYGLEHDLLEPNKNTKVLIFMVIPILRDFVSLN
jgi:hypothetical protein